MKLLIMTNSPEHFPDHFCLIHERGDESVKRIIISIIAALSITCAAAAVSYAADDSQYSVELNGTKLDAAAYDVEGTVYLPLRAVCEALGYSVGWSAEDHTATLSKDGIKISVNLNSSSVTEGDHQYFIGVMPASAKAYLTQDFFNDSLGLSITQDQSDKSFSLESAGTEIGVSIKNMKETSSDGKLDVTLNYPQLSGLSDQAVQDRINALFKQEAASAKQEGLDNIKDYPSSLSPNKYETYFDYRIKYNRNNLLSVIFLDYQYTGGAHGSTIQKAYTLDLQTGKEFTMKDLFKTGSDYASLFNSTVKQGIKDRELYELTTFSAISADQAFYLDNSGVSVYFQQYEYFPYAAGIQAFTLDYRALKDMLVPSLSFLCRTEKALSSGVKNQLNTGDIGSVSLKGNPTTGYTWQYKIQDESIVKPDTESSVPDSGLTGAGSTFTWKFKALKPGTTTITFRYYRPWEGNENALQTEEYTVTVL